MSFQLVLPDDFDEQISAAKTSKQSPSLVSDTVIKLPEVHPKQHPQHDAGLDVQRVNALQNKGSTPCCSTSSTGVGEFEYSANGIIDNSSEPTEEQNHYPSCDEHSLSSEGEIDSEHVDSNPPVTVQQVQPEPVNPVVATNNNAAHVDGRSAAGASIHHCDNCNHTVTSIDPLYDYNWTHITSPDATSKWICNHCNGRDGGAAKVKELPATKKNQLKQIGWFVNVANVESFDVSARYGNVSMHARHKISPDNIVTDYLPWLSFKNTKEKREACIRPHRHDSVPLIFFDDVNVETALSISAKYSACVIKTSEEGACHVWVHTDRALSERERYLVQRYLHERIGADGGSISGEHWGRLCGYMNWKRNCWVNLLAATAHKPLEVTDDMLVDDEPVNKPVSNTRSKGATSPSAKLTPLPMTTGSSGDYSDRDTTESGLEWGWTCENLAKGVDADIIESELYNRARERKKAGAQRYSQRTVQRAIEHVEAGRL